jgi:hypothetical protein
MSESRISTSSPIPLDLLSRASNYLVAGTLLCYVAGFAITNLHLGSMGIVTFDILRARYILSGLPFLLFLGAIGYLVFGLVRTLRKHYQQPRLSVITKVLWFSFFNIGVLYFVIPAIGIFAGSLGTPPYNIPQPTQPDLPWSDWLTQAPLSILRSTGVLVGILLLSAIILASIIIIINPKDKNGARTSRRQILSEAYKKIRESKGQVFVPLVGAFLFFYALNLLGSLLSFVLSGKVSATIRFTVTLQGGWAQFFSVVVIIYALIAVYLTFITLYPPSAVVSDDDTALSNTSAFMYFAAMCITITVPVYALRVYPALPQQIGGGQLLQVQVAISDDTVRPQFDGQNVETYLIDRTSNTSIFFLQNNSQPGYKIVEIPNELIQSIVYAQSP